MRVTLVEGTPDEIRRAFPHLGAREVTGVGVVADSGDGLAPDVLEIVGKAAGSKREAVEAFIGVVASWDGVEVKAGHRESGGLTPYVRFHRNHGPAFAYLYPRRGYLRPHLPLRDVPEVASAKTAKVRGGNATNGEWSRNFFLAPKAALDEALRFTRIAYDRADK